MKLTKTQILLIYIKKTLNNIKYDKIKIIFYDDHDEIVDIFEGEKDQFIKNNILEYTFKERLIKDFGFIEIKKGDN